MLPRFCRRSLVEDEQRVLTDEPAVAADPQQRGQAEPGLSDFPWLILRRAGDRGQDSPTIQSVLLQFGQGRMAPRPSRMRLRASKSVFPKSGLSSMCELRSMGFGD